MVSLYSFGCGLLFAVGLCVAEMTQPSKIIGFLDVTGGAWDPSLGLVMLPGLLVLAWAWRRTRQQPRPWFGGCFPGRPGSLDGRLVAGAALFGVGWGLSGFCPGPGLVAAASGMRAALVFVAAMGVGMIAYQWLDRPFGRLDEADAGEPVADGPRPAPPPRSLEAP